uniref:Uncharacterized protein n=1 Tax=Rhodnius prolixus TaxID=13249 RepID=T1HIM4_RHOPR
MFSQINELYSFPVFASLFSGGVVLGLSSLIIILNEKFREEVQNLAWYHFSAKFKASMLIVQEYNRQELQLTGIFKFKANMVSFSGE